jgi:hemerythrin-like domain-containing protein
MEATAHPTELLRADHRELLVKLSDLERVIDALNEPERVMPDLRRLSSFLKTELWTHVWKEEDALFPEIVRLSLWDGRPVEQMVTEHQDLRSANERFQRGVDLYLGDPSDREAVALIRKNGRRIIDLLKRHFHREESALFALADTHPDSARDGRILDLFEAIEADMAWCFGQLEEFYP